MPTYKIHEGKHHFVTCTIVDWIDVFTRPVYCQLVINSLAYCRQHKGLQVHAYVIMPSHLHMVLSSQGETLSGIVRDFKQFTSLQIWQTLHDVPESRREWLAMRFQEAAAQNPKVRHAQVWQAGNHPKVCESLPFTQQKVDYIHQNPVKARIVYRPEHYVWSSAQDYAGSKGPLEVDTLW